MVILTSVFLFYMQYKNAFATVTINFVYFTFKMVWNTLYFYLKSGSEMEYVIKIRNEYICGMKIFCHNIHLIRNLLLLHEYYSSNIWQTVRRHKFLYCQQLLNMNQNNCIWIFISYIWDIFEWGKWLLDAKKYSS